MASQNDNYVDSKFSHVVDPKDGYLVSDYRDAQNHKLLVYSLFRSSTRISPLGSQSP